MLSQDGRRGTQKLVGLSSAVECRRNEVSSLEGQVEKATFAIINGVPRLGFAQRNLVDF
jgi:hypothetical protein